MVGGIVARLGEGVTDLQIGRGCGEGVSHENERWWVGEMFIKVYNFMHLEMHKIETCEK